VFSLLVSQFARILCLAERHIASLDNMPGPRPVTGRAPGLPGSTHALLLRTQRASTWTWAWSHLALVNRLHHQAPNHLFASSSTPLPAWALPSHSCDTPQAWTEATSLPPCPSPSTLHIHMSKPKPKLTSPSEPLRRLEALTASSHRREHANARRTTVSSDPSGGTLSKCAARGSLSKVPSYPRRVAGQSV
jgi:hypothetical protein